MSHRTEMPPHYDAVIVGARVAGAATALLLARAGMRVLALERSAFGTDTLSTHALMRAGVMQLRRWGVLDRIVAAGTPPIRRTTFHYGAEAIPVDIQERDGVDALYAPRRTVLDAALADAAREAGANIEYGATMTGLWRDRTGRVRGVDFTDAEGRVRGAGAGIVIGADGVRSSVARMANAETLREGCFTTAVLYGYWRGLDLDGTHWHYESDGASGAIPTNDGLACVFAALRPEQFAARRTLNFDRLFAETLARVNPAIADGVARAERVGKFFPFGGRTGFLRQCWGPGWALIGDASYFKDPLTAHGMTDALRDAEPLARAVLAGRDTALTFYQQERDAFAAEFLDLSDEVASFDWKMDRLKELHRRLSKLMNRECDAVRSLDAAREEALCA